MLGTVFSVPDFVFGLPTHVLVVHSAVVLVPLTAVAAIVMAVSARVSVRFGPAIAAVAVAGLLGSVASRLTGPELALSVGVSEDHYNAGNLLPFFSAALTIAVIALWLIDRRSSGSRSLGTSILAVVVVTVAILAAGWTVRTGHTGSEQVWQGVADQAMSAPRG